MIGDDGSRETDACRGSSGHIPVLLPEVLRALAPADGHIIVDGTFGGGGYTRAILEAADCRVIAFDRDPSVVTLAKTVVADFPDCFEFVLAPFATLGDHVVGPVDAVVFDVGVSSMQLDDAARGFSFQSDGPLDMRMAAVDGKITDQTREAGASAKDLVNHLDETALANLIYTLGEERRSRAIARAIVAARGEAPIERTGQLADIVRKAYPRAAADGRHPATRTFQALRIAVNDELGQLFLGLLAAEKVLRPGGRLAVVTFHSLEDRIVKRFFTARSRPAPRGSRHQPDAEMQSSQLYGLSFRNVNQRTLGPNEQEIAANPRARSAKLRFGERTDQEPAPLDPKAIGVVQWQSTERSGR